MPVSLVLALAIGALASQDDLPGSRECLDDNHVNRCLPDVQAASRARLGLAAIETEAETGAEIYRALFVDGYGRDMPAVALERRRGQEPEVVVYGFDGQSMRSEVSAETWRRVVARSRFADRVLEPLPTPEPVAGQPPPFAVICLHSWVYTVEIANSRPARSTVESARSRTEDACDGGLASEFAMFLFEEAIKSLPACQALDLARTRNPLATCLTLTGDRLTAAELRNVRDQFGPRYGLDRKDPANWRAVIGYGPTRLDWAGEVIQAGSQSDEVAVYLAAKVVEVAPHFEQMSFEGLSSTEGVILGRVSYGDSGVALTAPYRQTWLWNSSGQTWQLTEMVVEPFGPATP